MTGTGSAKRSTVLIIITLMTFGFLYLPLVFVIIFSFNSSIIGALPLEKFTLDWYRQAFEDRQVLLAFQNTIVVGVVATFVSLILGTSAAFLFSRVRFRGRGIAKLIVMLPFVMPGIITGISLLLIFSSLGINRSLSTVILGHVVFCFAMVFRTVSARLQVMSRSYEEASYDLGANHMQTFLLVTLPNIRSALISAGLLTFVLSIDETMITFFVIGRQNTLPILIWSMLRRGFTPKMNAIVTVLFLSSLLIVLLLGVSMRKKE
jgi:spermidine/putrescine transport system permease protein